MSGSVLATSCRALASVCDARGLPTDALLAAAKISRATLDDADGRLSPAALIAFWEAAYHRLSEPALALHVAESLPRGAFRVVEYLASHSATVGEAFAKVARYFAVIDNTTLLTIEEDTRSVGFGPVAHDPRVPLPAIEFMLAASYLRIRDMTGVDFAPVRIELAAVETAYVPEIERVFRCPVSWRAAAHRLRFSRATWDTPTARPDPGLSAILEDHARTLDDRFRAAPRLVDRLVVVIDEIWARETPTLAKAAKRLGVSPRTLQRRIQEGGRSFSTVIDEARRRMAMRWLAEPNVSFSEIAFLLRFADQATFTRAVKRWTGRTPTEVRAAERGSPRGVASGRPA
jgi:AraC-like DNA-binding protein